MYRKKLLPTLAASGLLMFGIGVSGATAAGWMTFRFFGIEYQDACPPHDKQPMESNYLAIGASFLNGSTVPGSRELTGPPRENFFATYRDRKPEAIFGNSIYLYRVKD